MILLGKLAHIDDLKWVDLRKDFREQVMKLTATLSKRVRPKVMNGRVVNSNMLLQLAMELTEVLNSKDTPAVLTTLDRVVQGEANKIQMEVY